MNKIVRYINSHKSAAAQFVLFLLAAFTGGAAMAVTIENTDPSDHVDPQIGNEGPGVNTSSVNVGNTGAPNPGSNHEPVNPNTNDRVAPGGSGAGQDLTGSQASSTQLTKGDLVEDEWDSKIVHFRPFRTPLLSIVRRLATTEHVKNWFVKHMRVGGEMLEVVTTQNISAGDTITLTPQNVRGSLRPFYKGSTVFALGVPGYKVGSQSETEGELMLFVIDSSDKNAITLMAVNGPARSAGVTGDELDYVTCPAIPAGTVLSCGASAGSESQLMISPENYQPRPFEVYVQKKLLNIIMTDDFKEVKRKVPFNISDVRSDAISKFNIRAERTYWRGVKRRFNTQNADGSVEYVYTTEGLLWQLTNSYAIDNDYTLNDLIAISKLQFTLFAETNSAYVFCGKNAMERLLLVNPGDNRRIVYNDVKEWNIDFKEFKSTFGTLRFVYDETLDMLHMEDFMVVLDPSNIVRYVKIGEKEQWVDMSKGSGEVRSAKRFMRQEADGVALRGYNSILIGPKDAIFGFNRTKNMNRIISADSFPASPANGALIALTEDYTLEGTTYNAGTVYQYNSTSSTWSEYAGYSVAS